MATTNKVRIKLNKNIELTPEMVDISGATMGDIEPIGGGRYLIGVSDFLNGDTIRVKLSRDKTVFVPESRSIKGIVEWKPSLGEKIPWTDPVHPFPGSIGYHVHSICEVGGASYILWGSVEWTASGLTGNVIITRIYEGKHEHVFAYDGRDVPGSGSYAMKGFWSCLFYHLDTLYIVRYQRRRPETGTYGDYYARPVGDGDDKELFLGTYKEYNSITVPQKWRFVLGDVGFSIGDKKGKIIFSPGAISGQAYVTTTRPNLVLSKGFGETVYWEVDSGSVKETSYTGKSPDVIAIEKNLLPEQVFTSLSELKSNSVAPPETYGLYLGGSPATRGIFTLDKELNKLVKKADVDTLGAAFMNGQYYSKNSTWYFYDREKDESIDASSFFLITLSDVNYCWTYTVLGTDMVRVC